MKAEIPSADIARISAPAAWLAIGASVTTLLLLASLHVLSPEFDPSWRMVSEYAFGNYSLILSMMFLAWAASSWALVVAIRSQARSGSTATGLVFLVVAGLGEATAAIFDIRHDVGHSVAGLLGVVGLPIAAVLTSVGLGRDQTWHGAAQQLLRLAHLTWISVVLLIGTTILMAIQFAGTTGGRLPQHAPKVLPAGVMGLDGWANRLIVVTFCLWVAATAWQATKLKTQFAGDRDQRRPG